MTDKLDLIYILVPAEDVSRIFKWDEFTAPSLEAEGFLHASGSEAQVIRASNHKFLDAAGVAALCIDRDKVASEIREEWAGDPEPFPHIYGPLNTNAIIEIRRLARNLAGQFTLLESRDEDSDTAEG